MEIAAVPTNAAQFNAFVSDFRKDAADTRKEVVATDQAVQAAARQIQTAPKAVNMPVGMSESSNPALSPGDDGSGTGVPSNSTIQNVTNLANAIARDVAVDYSAVNAPPGTPVRAGNITVGSPSGLGDFSIGLVPLLLIGAALWLIFK